jgi:hypothetical protein
LLTQDGKLIVGKWGSDGIKKGYIITQADYYKGEIAGNKMDGQGELQRCK